jgi:predicted dienelactone hydrolase
MALTLTGIHIIREGPRWQMWPGYFLVAALCLSQIPSVFRPVQLPVWGNLAGLFLAALCVMLATIFPVFTFPGLTGPYQVASVTYHWVDASRTETLSSNQLDRRELMVQVWYPADPAPGAPWAAYRPSATTPFKKQQLSLVRTRARSDVPVARTSARFPVIVFCPAWNGGREQNTFQTEELASHGFVVAGMDHPYGTAAVAFPDGRIIRSVLKNFLDYSSNEALENSVRIADEQVLIRARDAMFVLDQLNKLNLHDPGGRFEGRLDLTRTGIFGHSFGGAVAVEACWLDPRFQAALNMDGLMFGKSAEEGARRPLFVMNDDSPAPTEAELNSANLPQRRQAQIIERDIRRIRRMLSSYGGYEITIRGSAHMNYSDSPLYTPIKRLSGAGPIDARRAMQIINAYSLAFLEYYLNGKKQPLLEAPAPEFPEVSFAVYPHR